jgi:protein gp37
MGDTKIPYCTKVWNVLHGCSKVSPGCDHCWAEREALMRINNPVVGKRYAGTIGNGHWTGRVNFQPDRLDEPKRWKKPQVVFVASQSDLFHVRVSVLWQEMVFS